MPKSFSVRLATKDAAHDRVTVLCASNEGDHTHLVKLEYTRMSFVCRESQARFFRGFYGMRSAAPPSGEGHSKTRGARRWDKSRRCRGTVTALCSVPRSKIGQRAWRHHERRDVSLPACACDALSLHGHATGVAAAAAQCGNLVNMLPPAQLLAQSSYLAYWCVRSRLMHCVCAQTG